MNAHRPARWKRLAAFLSVLMLVVGNTGCGTTDGEPGGQGTDRAREAEAAARPESGEAAAPPVVEVVTTDYAFTAPPEFPAGWVTVRLKNEAEQPHFVLLWRLPEDKDFADFSDEIAVPFADLYKQYRSGELDQPAFFDALTTALPDWFPPESRGGVALTSPGQTAETTVFLTPGEYVMECYVRAPEPDGDKFHNELGMLRPMIVSGEPAGEAPRADARITLSNYEILVQGELTRGEQTIAVHVAEAPEGLVGHDVNLVRLDPDVRVEDVAAWMSWVDALQPPGPAEFLGGAEQVMPGETSYITVSLSAGRYAWISEGYGAQGMVKEFVIE